MPDYEEKIRKTIKWKSKIKDRGISKKKKIEENKTERNRNLREPNLNNWLNIAIL